MSNSKLNTDSICPGLLASKCDISHPRTWRVDVQMILSKPKFFRCLDNHISYPWCSAALLLKVLRARKHVSFVTPQRRSYGTGWIFVRLKNHEGTLRSLGTVQYFHSVLDELWTARLLNFRTDKVFLYEGGNSLPSPCSAFSQSLSVNSLWWRIRGERSDHVTRNSLAARNNEA